MTFSKSGTVFCGKPFPRSDNLRFVDRILYQEDFKGANKDELDVMPSEFKVILFQVKQKSSKHVSFLFIYSQIL